MEHAEVLTSLHLHPCWHAGTPLSTGQSIVAGAVAGVPVSLLATPTELLKCRLQAQVRRYAQPDTAKVAPLLLC